MTADSRVEATLGLARNDGLRRDLAQIASRSTLTQLTPDQANRVDWSYQRSTVLRNVVAISLGLREMPAALGEQSDNRSDLARFVAQAWEQIAGLEHGAQAQAALLNAAINYDLAGYQANAACLARKSNSYVERGAEGALSLIARFIERRFVSINEEVERLTEEPSDEEIALLTLDELALRAADASMALSLSHGARFFLSGDSSELDLAKSLLTQTAGAFSNLGDATVYSMAASLLDNLDVIADRSIWKLLPAILPEHPRWTRYLRVLARGLGNDILEGHSVSELWPSQVRALERGVLNEGKSFSIRMPTSAGKTRVAELSMVHTLVSQPGARCVYIAPFRALATEVQANLETLFTDLGYAVSTVSGTYEQDEFGKLIAENDDLLVLTPEKLDLLLRMDPSVLEAVKLVVIDEGHIIGDPTRGPKVELLISRLRRLIPQARFLFMSAVVPQTTLDQLTSWLGGDEESTAVTGWRPAIQRYAQLVWVNGKGTLRFSDDDVEDGGLQFVPNIITRQEFSHISPETGRRRRPKFPESKGQVAAELAFLYASRGPVLIYCAATTWAQSVAKELLERVKLAELVGEPVPAAFRNRNTLAAAVAAEWLGEEDDTVEMFRRGIGFHHGRLPEAVRNAIEQDMRRRNIDVLVATGTLAQGVNLPFRTVIVHSTSRFDDTLGTMVPMSARDYWNIAGRAGRAGHETEGMVIHVVMSDQDGRDFHRYESHRTRIEELDSALLKMLNDLVAERISSEDVARRLDADLLALLVEESPAILDTKVLQATIDSTFFSMQATARGISTAPLVRVIHETVNQIALSVEDLDLRRVYASTGLSSASCGRIRDHVLEHRTDLMRIFAGEAFDRTSALDLILSGTVGLDEMQSNAPEVGGVEEILALWLDGMAVSEITRTLGEESGDVVCFIEEVFAYRLPWGMAGYLRIAGYVLEVEGDGEWIQNVASMIKYGVPTAEAAWAMTAGIVPRRTAIDLGVRFLREAKSGSASSFRRWLGALDPETLHEQYGLSDLALESTARAVFRSGSNEIVGRLDRFDDFFPIDVILRLQRRAIDRAGAENITGSRLALRRDYDSLVNRNSIAVFRDDLRLGYLPWAVAQAVAPELDSGQRIACSVMTVSQGGAGAEIGLRLTRSVAD